MMEKKFFSGLFLLLCASLLLNACGAGIHEEGNGNISQETRNVGAFFNLEIEGEYEIVLQEGANPLIAVETDENLHQYVETVIEGRTLRIRNIEKIKPSEQTRLVISYQRLEDIRLDGATFLSNRGNLKAESLGLRVDGASLVDLNLAAEALDLKLTGAGSVNLSGSVNQQQIMLSGAGNLAAFELQSKACNIEISGVGNAQVFVTDNLEATVSGVGGVRFMGDPRNLSREVTGLGRIERVNAK